ncbi:His/Gly/Thr/Pro-type tRNA ligase C-terminal domain-containing protein [Candidatus Saccharibacteria bacterium]|nr:His/Gly/Thr/Pro-type tRNA ligase C-terminal domain-containing protein [Candidatus Saccharibacteria bacterium]
MQRSKLFTKTSKTTSADEVAKNAQLLARAGFIHKEMAGVYAYLPLGLRVLEKIKTIVREEMNAIGGQEVALTALQPRELFDKTNRWDDSVVDNWFKTKLKNDTELGLGLTHEEPITNILLEHVSSYKDLPISVYQIQNKFRNELRAKSGLLRGREFVMKDMYSFARTQAEHDEIYEQIAAAYHKVYQRLGIGDITFRTKADGGYFTDKNSDEYQTLSAAGEDTIYLDPAKKLAINKEIYTDENLAKLGLNKSDLVEQKSSEVGNIFPLESKYPDALDLYYTDETGQKQHIIMGCYGIGISRLMGVLAEVFADDQGLVWPTAVAPFQVYLIGIGDQGEAEAAELYTKFVQAGIEVLWDDRDSKTARPGEKLADADLMGIPYRIVVSDKTLEQGSIEVKPRTGEPKLVKIESDPKNLQELLT